MNIMKIDMRNLITRLIIFTVILLTIIITTSPKEAFAVCGTPEDPNPCPTPPPLKTAVTIGVAAPSMAGLRVITNPGSLISATIGIILIVSALAAFLYLVLGGVRWITSGGDKAGLDAARDQITAALLGLFIVFGAWAFMIIIQTFFGVHILGGIDIPTPFNFQ